MNRFVDCGSWTSVSLCAQCYEMDWKFTEQLGRKRYIESRSQSIISLVKLTRREQEVLHHICKGHSMVKVAEILNLAPSTIITHKRRIFQKFNINSLVRLGVLAERYGFLH